MKLKSKRLLTIKRIIENEKISSQEDLSLRLRKSGIKVTQSTLSRDLKELNVAKTGRKNETPYYFIPEENGKIEEEGNNYENKAQHGLNESIKSISFSKNIAVIKTLPGYANAVTVIIDNHKFSNILGTIAGDDTIFIVMREFTSELEILTDLSKLFKNIPKIYKA